MDWRKLTISMLAAFLTGAVICSAYLFTTGMLNPINSMTLSKSWAKEENNASDLTVSEETVMYKQNIYLCGCTENLDKETDLTALLGMNHSELEKMFTSKDGWQVKFVSPNELILARKVDNFCSTHQEYRHLGIYQDQLAVFKGPLGINTDLQQLVPGKKVQDLPQHWQDMLYQAMDFNNLDEKNQNIIRNELEFNNEKALNAVLENLDEIN